MWCRYVTTHLAMYHLRGLPDDRQEVGSWPPYWPLRADSHHMGGRWAYGKTTWRGLCWEAHFQALESGCPAYRGRWRAQGPFGRQRLADQLPASPTSDGRRRPALFELRPLDALSVCNDPPPTTQVGRPSPSALLVFFCFSLVSLISFD